jgi:spore photoproduct lyase
MNFELDALYIEEDARTSPLAQRVITRVLPEVEKHFVADGRIAARSLPGTADAFGAGKRRLVLMRRRGAFLMGCPAGSSKFACCGYQVLVVASNCPMDCSYCFLQEHVADNPGLQIYTNYTDAFDELDRLAERAPERSFRIGTGELADSLAFDSITGISVELVEYFSKRGNLLLELKTKTDEIDNLLTVDPRGRTLVAWTLSPERVFRVSEHRTASPAARIDAARRVLEAGYKVAFHLDPIIAYAEAEPDYVELLEKLFLVVPPRRIAFMSIGGLRMTPRLRAIARRRFPSDPMLVGEEALAPDGRYRAWAPLRLRLFSRLRERIARADPQLPIYLCMEGPSAHQHVFGAQAASPAQLGARLARV